MKRNGNSCSTLEAFQPNHLSVDVVPSGVESASSAQHVSSEPVIDHSHQNVPTANAPSSNPQDLSTTPVQSTPRTLGDRSSISKWKHLRFRCCWPVSMSAIFVGLGKLVTGYHLVVVLPNVLKYWASKSDSSTGTREPNIPFENLQEENPSCPRQQNSNLPTATDERQLETITTSSSPSLHVIFKLPFFIVILSFSQWIFYHFIMNDKYDGWWSAHLEFNPLKRYEIWRFLTAAWIHGTVAHLWGNLRLQLITGCCLEVVHGWKRVSTLYFGGILFANLTTSVAEPFLRAYGASGGVYALLTGHLASNIMNWKETWGSSNRCLLILIYLGISIVAVLNNIVVQHVLPTHHLVGHAAHIGGALAGFLLGFCLLEIFCKTSWKIKATKICQHILIILFILAVGANIGDQIFYWKSVEYERRKKLLLLQNHTVNTNASLYSNTNTISTFHSKTASNAFFMF